MKRLWRTALAVSGALVATACGSTVQVTGSQVLPGNGGLDTPGALVQSAPPGVVEGGLSSGRGPVAAPGVVHPSGVGSSPGSVMGPNGGPQVVTPGATKTPIQIGVLITDTDSFKRASGSGDSGTVLTRDSIHAYLKAINAAGGIAGRTLSIVDATMSYSAASYDNEFEAACQKLTKDNHVAAVIYDGITYNTTLNTCLTKAGVPAFYLNPQGMSVGDDTDLRNHPGMITTGSVSIDRRLRAILNGSIAHGFLRSGSKLGVIVETCPYHVRAFDRALVPIVTRHKITVFRTDVDCTAGSTDHTTGINAVGAAVLRYRSEGVGAVMLVTNYESGTWFYFATAAEAQKFRPQYLLWHNQGTSDYIEAGRSSGIQPQQMNARGFGGLPLSEVTYPPAPPPAQAAVRKTCLATAKSQRLAYSVPWQKSLILDACDVVNLLSRALTLSGGIGGTRALAGAVERLGTGFVSSMTLNGQTRFGPARHDGLALGAVSVWQDTCQCLAYITRPTPIP